MSRLRLVLLLCALLALAVGVTTASAGNGGNSSNAKLCQKYGYQQLYTSTGQAFRNVGACVSYAARGGTPTTGANAQADCEAAGGTYTTDPTTNQFGLGTLIFSCLGYQSSASDTLSLDCFRMGGNAFGYYVPGSPDPQTSSCIRQ